jgi:GTP-binding protein HflX
VEYKWCLLLLNFLFKSIFMGDDFSTMAQTEKAVLVGIVNNNQDERKTNEYLEELAFLTDTAGGTPVKWFVQKLDAPNPRTYLGTGKLIELENYVKENEIDLVVFDDELTPSQLRNLEKSLECKILDRTNLILDIFAKRARTSYAKTQVELAQYQYLLPRLTRLWTHLERQRGGIGLRGPGETELETDRRIIRDKIALLKEQLIKIDRQMATQRKGRGNMVRISLVGYTNVGKSTIMNLLSKSEVFAENKLFATLDTTVRKVVIENLPFLLSDTVGFIRKLPHHLVESFKSTLDEVREADILLHVVDISHPNFEEQMQVVNQTLADLQVKDKVVINVFNKIDAYQYIKKDEDDLTPRIKENMTLEELKQSWMGQHHEKTLFISATEKSNVDELKTMLYEEVKKIHVQRYPYDHFLF